MEVIKAKDLSKTFRVKQKEKGMKGSIQSVFRPQIAEVRAVDGVSFAVEEGEILAFIGPNGAGKSTTIKMLTGILYPDGGMVEVLGINPTKKRKQLAYEIGTVFGQKEQLWTHLTPYDNFRFFGAIYDIKDRETEARIQELAEVFELGEFLNTPVRNLSLGQRIRCEIVAAFIHKPKILFLDEPTIGLDPVVKEEKTPLPSVQGITVLKENGYRLKLEVDTAKIKINEALRYIDTEQVEDINISNIPLENIIMEIYKSEGRAQAAL